MKNEIMYDGITGIREDIVLQAENYQFDKKSRNKGRKDVWMKYGIMAACVCLAVGLGVFVLGIGRGAKPGDTAGSGSGGNESGSTFMSYAGPVFPLNVLNDATGITAARNIDFDFAPYETKMKYHEISGGETGYQHYEIESMVTDSYLLRNTTGEDIVLKASYPFIGTFSSGYKWMPTISVDDNIVETKLYAGRFSGGFYSAHGLNTDKTDRSNIKSAGEWTDFQALLEDGSYIADAYAEYPKLNQNVTVYKLSDIAYDGSDETATNPTIGMEFKVISLDTRILSYGSTGGRRDMETGEFQQCYHIPEENERGYGMDRYLIVLGEDITGPEIQGYRDGGCEEGEEIKGVTADVERYETTLGEIVWELLIEEREPSYFDEEQVDIASAEMLFGSIAELMYDYGILSDNVAERYEWGSLEDMWSETYNMQRVMYVSFEVVAPANGSVRVDASMRKDASFDFVGEGMDRNGYDMVTQLGSVLEFSEQTASVSNTQFIEIVNQNFGFDLENGITQVELDLNEPYYYMEIRKISSEGEENISIN